MTLETTYRQLAQAIEDTYGVVPNRISPANLREGGDTPFAALGWSLSEDFAEVTISNVATGKSFLFGYYAEGESELLAAVDKLVELFDLLPECLFIEIDRYVNEEEIAAFDYAFTMAIVMEQ